MTPTELYAALGADAPVQALTIHQPFASGLISGRPVESRARRDGRRPYGWLQPGWLGVHAGDKVHPWGDIVYKLLPGLAPLPELPRMALIGAIWIEGWLTAAEAARVPELAPWVFPNDPTRFYLRHDPARAIAYSTPIPCPGAQGIWNIARQLARVR